MTHIILETVTCTTNRKKICQLSKAWMWPPTQKVTEAFLGKPLRGWCW